MGNFTFKEDKKILIVSDKEYQVPLFRFRNEHPLLDIKFMSVKELKDSLTFIYLKDPIPYLIKEKGIEYNKAKKYATLLKAPYFDKNPVLKNLYEELKGTYIPTKNDPLLEYELKQYNIYVFEDDEDEELFSLLSLKGYSYTKIDFLDLGFKELESYTNPKIYLFTDKFNQFFYVFSKLREILLLDPSMQNKVNLLVKDDSDLFYVKFFSKLFKIEYYTRFSDPLKNNENIKNKIKQIYKDKSLVFTEEELTNPDLKTLFNLIKEYRLDEINDFDYAYLNLIEIINSKDFVTDDNTKGVILTNRYMLDDKNLIFVTNFEHGEFYKEAKDNNVISDEALLSIGANTSYFLSKLDRRKKLNYIKYQNIALLSRVERHLNDKIYDSQFIEELNWKDNQTHKNLENEGVLTSEAKYIFNTYIYDEAFYYKEEGKINSYDHSFKGIKDLKNLFKDRSLSVSQLKNYVQCPFKYYLMNIIPVNDNERHQLWKGILIHSCLEDVYKEDYDYEKAFAKAKSLYYKEMEKCNYKASKKEEVIIDIIHHWLYPIIMTIRNERSTCKYFYPIKNTSEYRVEYNIGNNLFKGVIDKILFTDPYLYKEGKDGKKYFTIVDYKTGSHSNDIFNPLAVCSGYDIQLPLYYYALHSNPTFNKDGLEFGGMGIKHVYGNKIKDAYSDGKKTGEDILNKKLQIEGLFYENAEYFKSFNDEDVNDKGEIKNPKYISSKQLFTYDGLTHTFKVKLNGTEINYSLEEMIEDAIEAVEKNVDKILNGQFEIAPISTKLLSFDYGQLTCKYCPYRDVCYRSIFDARDLGSEIIKPKFKALFDKESEVKNDA